MIEVVVWEQHESTEKKMKNIYGFKRMWEKRYGRRRSYKRRRWRRWRQEDQDVLDFKQAKTNLKSKPKDYNREVSRKGKEKKYITKHSSFSSSVYYWEVIKWITFPNQRVCISILTSRENENENKYKEYGLVMRRRKKNDEIREGCLRVMNLFVSFFFLYSFSGVVFFNLKFQELYEILVPLIKFHHSHSIPLGVHNHLNITQRRKQNDSKARERETTTDP